ncbi:MAG TPA: DUF1573 domain-containing protein [Verrucomicrobiae bacterium]|jgi:hypothetical protein
MKHHIRLAQLTITFTQLAAASALLAQGAAATAPPTIPARTAVVTNASANTITVPAAAPAITKTNAPHLQFAETVFDFGRAKASDTLKHEFIFTNTGTALLEITGVQPGCGCTTAGTWDHQIEPGKAGKIPIQFNPSSYNGPISKSIIVTCNDPAQATHFLQIKAAVWRPIDVQPTYVNFLQVEGEETNETKVVRIINNFDDPITLEPPAAANPAYKTELKTVRPGKEFELLISYVGAATNFGVPANFLLKTSATGMPSININAFAMAQAAVTPVPQMIVLPSTPVSPGYHAQATIRNNSRTPVQVSEPTINAEGVTAEVKEVEPGKVFNVTLSFATNFVAKSGQSMALMVKTTHPKYPVVRVPITQTTLSPPVSIPVPLVQPTIAK